MAEWKVDRPTCVSVFAKIDGHITDASTAHKNMSTAIDDAAGLFSDSKFSSVANSLNGLYNRCFTRQMTNGDTQLANAVGAGRGVVAAFDQHAEESTAETEAAKSAINWNAPILDGKKVS